MKFEDEQLVKEDRVSLKKEKSPSKKIFLIKTENSKDDSSASDVDGIKSEGDRSSESTRQ